VWVSSSSEFLVSSEACKDIIYQCLGLEGVIYERPEPKDKAARGCWFSPKSFKMALDIYI